MKDTVVLYHRGCNDGIVAAWAAREKLGDSADYLTYQYGEELPYQIWGRHLIMVDLSLPEELLFKVRSETKSILIIDHHKTAAPLTEMMEPIDTFTQYLWRRADLINNLFIKFDMAYSGAVLSWAFFNNVADLSDPTKLPWVLRLIQDYDLWEHKLDDTKAVNAWLINGGLTMDRVSQLMSHEEGVVPEQVLEVGRALLKYDDKIIKSVLREYVQVVEMADGAKCAMVNAPHHLRNDLADRLSDKYDFVVSYTRRKERTVYSLRSKGYDVSEIAKRFGGGGHKEAAAFSIPHTAGSLIMERGAFTKPSFIGRLKAAWEILTTRYGR